MKTLPLDSYAYSLARIRWDVFGTLTFRSVPPPKRAHGRAWALMRRAAELVQRPYSQLLIGLRAELGEMTGRFHFHFLLGGTKTRNEITLAYQLEYEWFGMFGQGAISKCRPYDRSRAGVAYVTKCLGTRGANEYEVRKFNLADTVTLSRSVFRVIRSLDRMGMDATARTCGKRRASDEGATGSAGLVQPPGVLCPKGPAPGLRGRKRGCLASQNAALLPRT